MRRAAALCLAFTAMGCDGETPVAEVTPLECPPFEPVTRDPLALEAVREAHRWAALRRHLRLEEARAPGHVLRLTADRVSDEALAAGRVCFADVYTAGRILFEHEIAPIDGLGNELASIRPRNRFRRVHEGRFGGPETINCRSCHWRGGTAGAGDLPDAAMLLGDGDTTSSADPRNPPPLHGAGVVQAIAVQMTVELARARDALVAAARRSGRTEESELVASGTAFGVLRARPDGSVDTSDVAGVDADLVVRPFGWKGNFATIREIATMALHVHMGIQSEGFIAANADDTELLGDGPDSDPDRDGVTRELTEAQVTALVAFLAAQAVPVYRPHERLHAAEPAAEGLIAPTSSLFIDEWREGRERFQSLGCASCHRPMTVLTDPTFRSVAPSGALYELDLATQAEHPRIALDEELGGYPVFLFSDLRRHDLGEENAEQHEDRGVSRASFLTRPLWGLADSAPWLHDGRAPSLDLAIAGHGGEAADARAGFEALSYVEKGALRVYLMSLRRQWRPVVP